MTTRLTDPSLVVHDVTLDPRLDSVSFSAAPGTLTALIGPSGAGKSTLAQTLAGAIAPDSGIGRFDGSVGMVPQDDIVHGKLPVAPALQYGGELRGAGRPRGRPRPRCGAAGGAPPVGGAADAHHTVIGAAPAGGPPGGAPPPGAPATTAPH